MRHRLVRLVSIGLILFITACVSPLENDIETALTNPEHTGIRWGLVVADMDGTELIAMRADDRFTPASNVKIVTTMASYHHYDALSADAVNPGTTVYLEEREEGAPSLILKGSGDAQLSDRADCETTCLASLADQVAATGLAEIHQVIGDDTLFPFERWGVGWSVEDLQFYYGTAISALSVNDNLVWIDVAPGEAVGAPAKIEWNPGDFYLELVNETVTTGAQSDRALRFERYPGGGSVRVYGDMPLDHAPLRFALAIDNPAEFAALRFKTLLEARGISVGGVETRHRPLTRLDEVPDPESDAALIRSATPISDDLEPIATLPASPLTDSLKRISKDSQNLHADIALRRLGLISGTGSRAYGVAALQDFLDAAGVPEHSYTLHGGSGLSVYNRFSPRGMVKLLAFAAQQDWFEAWIADQPIGGVDGSLARRFKGTVLEGKIFAKTGTLNGANALSGMMIAESGRPLLFSILANDRPASTRSAIPEMDAALVLIAAAY